MALLLSEDLAGLPGAMHFTTPTPTSRSTSTQLTSGFQRKDTGIDNIIRECLLEGKA